MVEKVATLVKEVTTAGFAGTGPVQLAGQPSGEPWAIKFVDGVGDTNTCEVVTRGSDGQWERTKVTVTAGSPDTLSRDTVVENHLGTTALINFTAGVKDVYLVGEKEPGKLVGEIKEYVGKTAPSGYVLADGKTIGNAASSATSRANADTVDLFTLLWNDWADAQAPVSSGRGVSAAADFAANKTITLPDRTGRAGVGLEVSATRLTVAGSGIDGGVIGDSGGSETHVLTVPELAPHTHPEEGAVADPTGSATGGNTHADTNPTVTGSTGGGAAHQNTQPSIVMNYIIRL